MNSVPRLSRDAAPALIGVAIGENADRLAPGCLLNRTGREPLWED